jgi:TRAP-type C4-dicarboxylate transport system permease small subunit
VQSASGGALDLFVRSVRWLSTAAGVVAVVLIIAACAVVCEMVFVRYALNASTVWQTEFVLYSVVGATLLGSPYVLAMRGHVGVELLGSRVGPRTRRTLTVIAAAAGIAFCGVLTASAARYFVQAFTLGWVTESVWAPRIWIVALPLPLGLGLLTLQSIADAAALLAKHDADERGGSRVEERGAEAEVEERRAGAGSRGDAREQGR